MTVLALVGAWSAYTSVSLVLHEKILASRDIDIANARLAYHSLLGEVVEYQRKFTSITLDLEENHALMLNLVERNSVLQRNLKSVAHRLTTTDEERREVIAVREHLKGQLRQIEDRMGTLVNRNFALKGNLGTVEVDLQTALVERNRALFDGNRMRRHINDLETRLGELQEAELQSVQRLTDRTVAYIESVEKVVRLTGLTADRLLEADTGSPRGQGGPFIAVEPDALPADRLKANLSTLDARLQHSLALESVMRKVPLSAPLDSFSITSRFGKRRDPINRKWAAHYGVDLGSVFKSPVYVTAPGVVTYAGWSGKYGKVIEVEHGAGIKTRYGHLHKILVKKGRRLKFRDKIGLLGSTGRSTGAHLHYEILFKGKAKNPMKFIKAGRHVFQE
ncbi:MAG: peptidoglycan DD-metalloendopeptidase family protein [Proteobacteria bacterium]|nr:peptidoglycan DD-metalloendopeptidase family protein [Pseudomonadota bacterium]